MTTGKLTLNLGQALVKTGNITADQCKMVIKESVKTGMRIKDILVKQGLVSERELERIFSRKLNLPAFSLHGLGINPEVKKLLPRDLASKHLTIPVFTNGNILAVATDDPLDFKSLRVIADHTQKDILTTFTRSDDIKEYLEKKYEEVY